MSVRYEILFEQQMSKTKLFDSIRSIKTKEVRSDHSGKSTYIVEIEMTQSGYCGLMNDFKKYASKPKAVSTKQG